MSVQESNQNVVQKRQNHLEPFDENKLRKRLGFACEGLAVDENEFYERVLRAIPRTITTKLIDAEIARLAATHAIDHPDYDRLASRVFAKLIQKDVGVSFSEAMGKAYAHTYENKQCKLVADDFYRIVQENREVLNLSLIHI